MGRSRNPSLFEELAVAVAAGRSIRDAATALNMPRSTAWHWAAVPAFKARVEVLRRALTERTIERISEHAALLATNRADRQPVRMPLPAA